MTKTKRSASTGGNEIARKLPGSINQASAKRFRPGQPPRDRRVRAARPSRQALRCRGRQHRRWLRQGDPDGQCGLEAACVFDRLFITGRIAATRGGFSHHLDLASCPQAYASPATGWTPPATPGGRCPRTCNDDAPAAGASSRTASGNCATSRTTRPSVSATQPRRPRRTTCRRPTGWPAASAGSCTTCAGRRGRARSARTPRWSSTSRARARHVPARASSRSR